MTQQQRQPSTPLRNGLLASMIPIVYVTIRIAAANQAPITDCDEVFNYWEPIHFIHYGSGLQTWEYASQYALRTYAYLLPMSLFSRLYDKLLTYSPSVVIHMLSSIFCTTDNDDHDNYHPTLATLAVGQQQIHKPLVFQLLRATVALLTSLSELNLYRAIQIYSPSVALWFLVTLLTSAGMFHAAPAYVPSSTVMSLWMNSAACQLRGNNNVAILWGLVAVLAIGWPFCAILFVPLGLTAIYQERKVLPRLLARTFRHALGILIIVTSIDYRYYGKITFPNIHIFFYNASSGGDELYGVEPLSYYVKNLLLNWNGVTILGLFSFPLLLTKRLFWGVTETNLFWKNITILLLPMYLWLAVVLFRPHKEERFLFPVYPMMGVGCALVLDDVTSVITTIVEKRTIRALVPISSAGRNEMKKFVLGLLIMTPMALLSISRSMAMADGYTAPLKLYNYLYYHISPIQQYVCTGGEWYRYPSSYYLPNHVQLAFLKSSFRGQLPRPFTPLGSRNVQTTTTRWGTFNDANLEDIHRYINITDCDFIVELVNDDETPPECVQYMKTDGEDKWNEIARFKFLDVERTSMFHRILYVPFRRRAAVYKGYALYERRWR